MPRRPSREYHTSQAPRAAHQGHLANPPTTVAQLRDAMEEWIKDLEDWGQRVRDDIIRLEAATGVGLGDPGDPPAGPWA